MIVFKSFQLNVTDTDTLPWLQNKMTAKDLHEHRALLLEFF